MEKSENDHKVVIIGLGWLGLPLAKSLIKNQYDVIGTVTSTSKCERLTQQNIHAELFSLYGFAHSNMSTKVDPELSISPRLQSSFKNASLVINIPPGRRNFNANAYVKSVCTLIKRAYDEGAKKVIFISTTSVYGKQQGVIDNNTPRLGETESAKAHIEIEDYLYTNFFKHSNILRPAGLVGKNELGELRHPIFTLCKKQNIPLGNNRVSLIHQSDVIAAITQLILHNTNQHAFNLSALDHPTRKQYYIWCSKQLNLNAPHFVDHEDKHQTGKIIDASDTFSQLRISLNYPSPYDMLI